MSGPVAGEDVETAIDRLYGLPLDEFVAGRTRLAKELRGRGERPAAARIAKLAKPTVAAGALNQVAHTEPDAVAEWVSATAALREASERAAELGGGAVRDAMAAHREATARLVDLARRHGRSGGRGPSAATLDDVRALLRAATMDAELAEELRRGRVTSEAAHGDEAAARAEAANGTAGPRARHAAETRPARRRTPEPPAPRRPTARERQAEARRAELARRVEAARDAADRLAEEAERRVAAADEAEARRDDARRALHRAESEAAAARAAAEDADAHAAAARSELRQAESLLRRARRRAST